MSSTRTSDILSRCRIEIFVSFMILSQSEAFSISPSTELRDYNVTLNRKLCLLSPTQLHNKYNINVHLIFKYGNIYLSIKIPLTNTQKFRHY